MYIDQQPRISKSLPKLCKLAYNDNPDKKKKQQNQGKRSEDDSINMIKEKIFLYFQDLNTNLAKLPRDWEAWGERAQRETFKPKIESIYNQFTLQLLKITSLIVKFGKYCLDLDDEAQIQYLPFKKMLETNSSHTFSELLKMFTY